MIEVNHLAIERDQTSILEDINFTVDDGELVALLGPSGAGKSTLLRAIAGLEPITAGSIGFHSERYPNIAMVFQDYALFPHLSVEDNLKTALVADPDRKKSNMRDEFIVRILRIQNLLNRKPHEISAGQRQRVGLARALLVNPDIVLLDEPFANLDEQTKKDLNAGLRAVLMRRKITAILVTHDFDEAQVFADRIAILMAGQIQQFAQPSVIYHQPINRIVGEFIGDLIRIKATYRDDKAYSLFGEVPVIPPASNIGQDVELFIRSEDFFIDEQGVKGRVIDTVFHGEDTVATVQFADLDNTIDIRLFWPSHVHKGEEISIGLKKRPYKIGPLAV